MVLYLKLFFNFIFWVAIQKRKGDIFKSALNYLNLSHIIGMGKINIWMELEPILTILEFRLPLLFINKHVFFFNLGWWSSYTLESIVARFKPNKKHVKTLYVQCWQKRSVNSLVSKNKNNCLSVGERAAEAKIFRNFFQQHVLY